MPPRKKPRLCGGCSSTDSISWHRQRGNNKFFCADCQAKKLISKRLSSSQQQQETSSNDPSSNNDPPPTFSSTSSTKPSSTSSISARISSNNEEEEEDSNLEARNQFDRRYSEDDDSSPELGGESLEPKVATIPTVEETVAIDPSVEASTDRQEEPPRSPEPSTSNSKKKQKSPIVHPRLTRLRTQGTSTIRPAITAARPSTSKIVAGGKQRRRQQRSSITSKIDTSSSAKKRGGDRRSNSRSSNGANNFPSNKSTGGSSSVSAVGGADRGDRGGILVVPRNKGRRHIFKLLKPDKAPSRRATVTTFQSLWHKGALFRESDIVSVVDKDDESSYYGSIRGLIRDECCRQFAVLTWLIPTDLSPRDRSFDAATYMLGPQDETMYPLDSLEFVCHVDTDFFKIRGATIKSMISSIDYYRSRSASSNRNNASNSSSSGSLNPKDQFAGIAAV